MNEFIEDVLSKIKESESECQTKKQKFKQITVKNTAVEKRFNQLQANISCLKTDIDKMRDEVALKKAENCIVNIHIEAQTMYKEGLREKLSSKISRNNQNGEKLGKIVDSTYKEIGKFSKRFGCIMSKSAIARKQQIISDKTYPLLNEVDDIKMKLTVLKETVQSLEKFKAGLVNKEINVQELSEKKSKLDEEIRRIQEKIKCKSLFRKSNTMDKNFRNIKMVSSQGSKGTRNNFFSEEYAEGISKNKHFNMMEFKNEDSSSMFTRNYNLVKKDTGVEKDRIETNKRFKFKFNPATAQTFESYTMDAKNEVALSYSNKNNETKSPGEDNTYQVGQNQPMGHHSFMPHQNPLINNYKKLGTSIKTEYAPADANGQTNQNLKGILKGKNNQFVQPKGNYSLDERILLAEDTMRYNCYRLSVHKDLDVLSQQSNQVLQREGEKKKKCV